MAEKSHIQIHTTTNMRLLEEILYFWPSLKEVLTVFVWDRAQISISQLPK